MFFVHSNSSNRRNDFGGGYGNNPNFRPNNRYMGPRKNEKGYHGDMHPQDELEQRLFRSGDSQVTGINFDKYDDIPVDVSGGDIEPYSEFTPETIGMQLFRNVELSGFSRPTPIQKYSIPIGLGGGDMMACAQTGSGKTAGFLFPLITVMLNLGALPEPECNKSRRPSFPSALVLAPTRELASQIYEESLKFCYCTGIRPVVVYGGTSTSDQTRELSRGVDLLVATPGRLVDLFDRGVISLAIVRFLVLDEADRMYASCIF